MITEYRIRLVFCLQCMLENINLLIFYSFNNFRDYDKNTQLCSVSIKCGSILVRVHDHSMAQVRNRPRKPRRRHLSVLHSCEENQPGTGFKSSAYKQHANLVIVKALCAALTSTSKSTNGKRAKLSADLTSPIILDCIPA